jgi:hypothetical protein
MIYARVADGIRGYFAAVNQGVIVTGIASSSFTATVVAPDLTTSTIVTVTQTTAKPGLYTFLVPSAFLQANGVGVYGIVVEVNKPAPQPLKDVLVAVIRVGQRDEDDIFKVSQAILGNVV